MKANVMGGSAASLREASRPPAADPDSECPASAAADSVVAPASDPDAPEARRTADDPSVAAAADTAVAAAS